MKGFVYILRSDNNHHYIGSTIDLKKRLGRHAHKTATATTKQGDWSLLVSREFDSIEVARQEEKRIKSFKGGNGLKKIIEQWRGG